jgi:hypothetical protein
VENVHIHITPSSPAKDCKEKTVWLEKELPEKKIILHAIA